MKRTLPIAAVAAALCLAPPLQAQAGYPGKAPRKTVEVNVPIPSLADFAREHGTSFFLLRQANPWLRSDHLTNKGGKTYRIAIP